MILSTFKYEPLEQRKGKKDFLYLKSVSWLFNSSLISLTYTCYCDNKNFKNTDEINEILVKYIYSMKNLLQRS